MKITLHRNQGTVFRSTSRFKVVAAGRRFGKTVLACVILFCHALQNKDRIYWLVAPTYGQAKELAWDILLKMIPPNLMAKKPNESELKITLRTGSTIHLKGADNPETLVGRGLSGLVIDEVTKIRNHKRVWEEILRPTLADYKGFCLFISTPMGKNYFWELWTKGQRKEEDYESWQFKSADNPFIDRAEIESARRTSSDRYFKQEWEASFEDFTGLVWPEFEYKKHVVEPFEIPKWWETIGAIDPAMAGTTASLFGAVDEDGCLYITGEYYEQNRRVSEVSDSIRGKCSRWVIDPASQIRSVNREGRLFSIFDEFSDNGICPRPAENDVDAGINRVAEYLKQGKIKIFKTCKNLLAEIERYHWTEERETVGGIQRPKPYKAFDHAVDCFRYLVMSRIQDSVVPVPKSEDRARPLAIELLTIDSKGDGIKDWI